MRKGDTLFLRERYSFDYARSLDLDCDIALDHDLGFSVDPGLLLTPIKAPRPSVKNTRKMLYIAYHYLRSRFRKSLAALRTDRESRIEGPKKRINDLSSVARFGTRDRSLNLFSARWLLKVLSWYDVVETDRLHVFVGCMLVGTKVVLHDSCYHKIRGVFEYSVRSHPVYSSLVVQSAMDRDPGPAQPQA